MKRNNWSTTILGFLACTLTIPAQAELITLTFGGTITEVQDYNSFLNGALRVGDSLLGSYAFESSIPDSRLSNSTLGVYEDAVQAMLGNVGGLPFELVPGGGGNMVVANDFWAPPRVSDGYSTGGWVWIQGQEWSLDLKMVDYSATALSSDAMPLEPPDLASFGATTFELYIESENVWVYGELTSLAPEPGSFLLTVCCCTGMLLLRSETSVKSRAR